MTRDLIGLHGEDAALAHVLTTTELVGLAAVVVIAGCLAIIAIMGAIR